MALPATDSFTTDTSDKALATYNASWTVLAGSWTVYYATDNVKPATGGAQNTAIWNADAFNANQYSQAKQTGTPNVREYGVCVRAAAGIDGYGYRSASDRTEVVRWDDGVVTVLASSTTTELAVDGQTLRLEADGTTITPKINGSTAALGAQTDATYNSGSAGICAYSYVPGDPFALDDWEGGDLGATPPAGNPWYAYKQQ